MENKTKINKIGYFEIPMRLPRRQLEVAVQCFEEVQKKPAGLFYAPIVQWPRMRPFHGRDPGSNPGGGVGKNEDEKNR